MKDWKWNGARWWKYDFHTHTPASDDYGKGGNQAEIKNRSPREWLLDYMHAEVDCVVITDHNTGAWIDPLKKTLAELVRERPEGFRPIHLFPGMEISVHGGVHLLAILSSDKSTSDIDSLLGAVGFIGSKGRCDAVTNKTFSEVVNVINQFDGIAIPAHVDAENGLFLLMEGITLNQALNCDQVFAMEMINKNPYYPPQYKEKRLSWTEVLGSDSHHPPGVSGSHYPGSHFSWVKMESPTLEGLRLALLDGHLSILRSDRNVENPNNHAPLLLESIEVSNARYMGRSGKFPLTFNPWLNTIIGGRGTGKSTLIEFLRIALRRESEIPDDLKTDFMKYQEVYQSPNDDRLLINNTQFNVYYIKDNCHFRVQWSPRGDLEPIQEQKDDGSWVRAEGEIIQRFPIRLFSQKQVFQLAKDPLALLKIIDQAPEVNRKDWNEKWEAEKRRFLSLQTKAREIESGITAELGLRGDLDDVKRKLAIFETARHADILKSYQNCVRQNHVIEIWERSWFDLGNRLREFAEDIVPEPPNDLLFKGDIKDALLSSKIADVMEGITEIQKSLQALAQRADVILANWKTEKERSDWKKALEAETEAYNLLCRNLAEEGVRDPGSYGELVQRRQAIEQRLKNIADRRQQVDNIYQQIRQSLESIQRLRKELSSSRENFLERVLHNNQYVRIKVKPYQTPSETIGNELRQILNISEGRFDKDIGSPDREGLLGELYSNRDNVKIFEDNLKNLKRKIRQISVGEGEYNSIRDKRFLDHLTKLPPEVFDRLELWFPEDTLDIQFSLSCDGHKFRSIQTGSPGQKTAALLAFLLSYGEEPLILDQPEDDLDNYLIYDLIVKQLRTIKKNRQIIVVTHNANIVVNGDAELVIALKSQNGETQFECTGSLQDNSVRETICAIMEGGREAFEQRYRRITVGKPHV